MEEEEDGGGGHFKFGLCYSTCVLFIKRWRSFVKRSIKRFIIVIRK